MTFACLVLFMLLSLSIASSLIWALHIILWSSCLFAALAILQFAKVKLPKVLFSGKVLAFISTVSFLISTIGIYAFEEKLLASSAHGHWNFGYSYQNEISINLEQKTYEIKESNGKTYKGFTTPLTKGDPNDDFYLYLYLLGYPNDMSTTMVKFTPLNTPQLHIKNQVLPCN